MGREHIPDVRQLIEQGIVDYKNGRYDRAINTLTKVIELCPDNIEAYYHRGLANKEKGEYHLAIADFNCAIDLDTNDYRAHCNRALVCEKTGLYQEALNSYRAFLKSAPIRYSDYLEFAKYRIHELQKMC